MMKITSNLITTLKYKWVLPNLLVLGQMTKQDWLLDILNYKNDCKEEYDVLSAILDHVNLKEDTLSFFNEESNYLRYSDTFHISPRMKEFVLGLPYYELLGINKEVLTIRTLLEDLHIKDINTIIDGKGELLFSGGEFKLSMNSEVLLCDVENLINTGSIFKINKLYFRMIPMYI